MWSTRQRVVRPPSLPQTGLANSARDIMNSMKFSCEQERDTYIQTFKSVGEGSRLLDLLKEFGLTHMDIEQQRVSDTVACLDKLCLCQDRLSRRKILAC